MPTSSAWGHRRRWPRVTTGAQAAARDQAAIAGGTPSFTLMQQAGAAAAAEVLRLPPAWLSHGVAVFAGRGNNGGDAYLVAAQLARVGVVARLHAAGPPATADAQRAAALAAPWLVHGEPTGGERVVVDGVLGTGHEGALREPAVTACARINLLRDAGAHVMALDVPSGVNASTGEVAQGAVTAQHTVAFGTLKRAHLLRRDVMGRVVLADIGLGEYAFDAGHDDDGAWCWASRELLATRVPPLAWDAHKGRRGKVALVGGDAGMAGAIVLAAQAALASGAGLAYARVHEASVPAVQALVPQALAHPWPAALDRSADVTAMDALAVGPGLGRSPVSLAVLERVLHTDRGASLVLDADALWLAGAAAHARGANAADIVREWTRDARAVVCTPHPGEFAQLLGQALPASWEDRVALQQDFAARARCTVLLKGAPTLVGQAHAPAVAVPYGTPLLATGGSGDCLTGVIATFLAQGMAASDAAVLGAAVHGLAAEFATRAAGHVRGPTLAQWREQLPAVFAWLETTPSYPPGVLAELPAVGHGRA